MGFTDILSFPTESQQSWIKAVSFLVRSSSSKAETQHCNNLWGSWPTIWGSNSLHKSMRNMNFWKWLRPMIPDDVGKVMRYVETMVIHGHLLRARAAPHMAVGSPQLTTWLSSYRTLNIPPKSKRIIELLGHHLHSNFIFFWDTRGDNDSIKSLATSSNKLPTSKTCNRRLWETSDPQIPWNLMSLVPPRPCFASAATSCHWEAWRTAIHSGIQSPSADLMAAEVHHRLSSRWTQQLDRNCRGLSGASGSLGFLRILTWSMLPVATNPAGFEALLAGIRVSGTLWNPGMDDFLHRMTEDSIDCPLVPSFWMFWLLQV